MFSHAVDQNVEQDVMEDFHFKHGKRLWSVDLLQVAYTMIKTGAHHSLLSLVIILQKENMSHAQIEFQPHTANSNVSPSMGKTMIKISGNVHRITVSHQKSKKSKNRSWHMVQLQAQCFFSKIFWPTNRESITISKEMLLVGILLKSSDGELRMDFPIGL